MYNVIMMNHYILTVLCPDKKGIVAALTSLLADEGANILDLTQHTASDMGIFMFKSLFETPKSFDIQDFERSMAPLVKEFSIDWQLYDTAVKQRMAILVSKTNHCLWEILLEHVDNAIDCEIGIIISNHPDNEQVARQFGIPFHYVNYSVNKETAEKEMLRILAEYQTDFVVLARFMQILSPQFIKAWKNKIINIHHGFLPAFKGAKPYHQAWYKGVKIIGATAHFATEDLDQGPIIAQEVLKVNDRASISQLVQMGKNIERRTLVDAISLYLNHAIVVYENRTFIMN